jgi:hypothetical protein
MMVPSYRYLAEEQIKKMNTAAGDPVTKQLWYTEAAAASIPAAMPSTLLA